MTLKKGTYKAFLNMSKEEALLPFGFKHINKELPTDTKICLFLEDGRIYKGYYWENSVRNTNGYMIEFVPNGYCKPPKSVIGWMNFLVKKFCN